MPNTNNSCEYVVCPQLVIFIQHALLILSKCFVHQEQANNSSLDTLLCILATLSKTREEHSPPRSSGLQLRVATDQMIAATGHARLMVGSVGNVRRACLVQSAALFCHNIILTMTDTGTASLVLLSSLSYGKCRTTIVIVLYYCI